MINFQYSVDGSRAMARLNGLPDALAERVRRIVTRFAIELQGYVKEGKLTGEVLHVRTGTLRRSINNKVVTNAAGTSGSVGTNVKYGRVHEYGFNGAVSVKGHLRTIKQAFGKSIAPTQVEVSGFTRNMRVPERSFLRSALKDMKPQLLAQLEAAKARL